MTSSLGHLPYNKIGTLGSVKLSDIGWVIIFNLCLFTTFIQNAFGFSYVDEIVTVLAIFLYARRSVKSPLANPHSQHAEKCLLCLFAVVCIGFLGNLFSGLGTSPVAVAIDLFACIKMPLALICLILVIGDIRRVLRFIEGECKLLAVILLACGLIDLVVPLPGLYGEIRYGIRSFTFAFGHPESMVFVCVGMTVVLCSNLNENRLWILILAIVACLSLRTKGMVFAALVAFLVFTWGRSGRFSIWHLLIGAFVALFIGWDQYQAYYNTDGIARNELMKAAGDIAVSYFPFGSGFASFGSNVTANPAYYSPLYYKYGLNTVYGLRPDNPAFLSDTFWPIIIGQFGWLAFVVFCASMLFLFLFAYQSTSNGGGRLAVVVCFTFLLISSTAESAFFNPQALFLAVCLAFVIAFSREVATISEPTAL